MRQLKRQRKGSQRAWGEGVGGAVVAEGEAGALQPQPRGAVRGGGERGGGHHNLRGQGIFFLLN